MLFVGQEQVEGFLQIAFKSSKHSIFKLVIKEKKLQALGHAIRSLLNLKPDAIPPHSSTQYLKNEQFTNRQLHEGT